MKEIPDRKSYQSFNVILIDCVQFDSRQTEMGLNMGKSLFHINIEKGVLKLMANFDENL